MTKVYGFALYSPESTGPDYLIEIPALKLSTQAETMEDSLLMAGDLVAVMMEEHGFDFKFFVRWEDIPKRMFSISSDQHEAFTAFMEKLKSLSQ